jgi:hypothetical protein
MKKTKIEKVAKQIIDLSKDEEALKGNYPPPFFGRGFCSSFTLGY